MPSDSVIKLGPLSIRQRYRVRFQALPDRIQQFRLLRRGQTSDLASQIVHTPTTVARFLRSGKRLMRTRFQLRYSMPRSPNHYPCGVSLGFS